MEIIIKKIKIIQLFISIKKSYVYNVGMFVFEHQIIKLPLTVLLLWPENN